MSLLDDFWTTYDQCLDEVAAGVDAEQLIDICTRYYGKSAGDAFFPNGGDRDLAGTLMETGWSFIWSRADYYFAARDKGGNAITFVEGDIYRGNQRPIPNKSDVDEDE